MEEFKELIENIEELEIKNLEAIVGGIVVIDHFDI